MNIQQFQYVLAVAELRHFERAAEKCFVTQSTLSTMVRKLEDELGIKIFDRRKKPVSVTNEGKEIIEQIQIVVREINSLENKVQELKGEMAGELKIGVIPTVAPYLLPLFLSEFAQRFSKVQIRVQEMTTGEIQRNLKNRSLDIGIAAIPLEDLALQEIALYDEPFLLFDCFSKAGNNTKVGIKDIDYSHLLLLEEGHCFRTQVQQLCKLSKVQDEYPMNFEFRAGSIDSLIRFTKVHKGITLLPHMATLDLSKADKKRIKAFKAPIPYRSVGLLVHKYFVKKRLLREIQNTIQAAISLKLIKIPGGKLFKPVG